MPGIQLRTSVARQRLQLEIEEFVDIQRARLVLFVKRMIARRVQLAIQHAVLNQELRPLEVRIPGQQGIIEIEQDEFHNALQDFNPPEYSVKFAVHRALPDYSR